VSTKRLRNLGDAFRAGVLLEIACSNAECGRVRLVSPGALLGTFGMAASFAAIGARMVCRGAEWEGGGCGQRGALVRYRFTDPPPPDGPPNSPPNGRGNVVPFAPPRPGADGQCRTRPQRRVAKGNHRAPRPS
jgi:hypothetical protein